jgi:hypothetical protein
VCVCVCVFVSVSSGSAWCAQAMYRPRVITIGTIG